MPASRNLLIGDVSLCREDLALLVPPRWINDQIIAGAFELFRTRTAPADDRWLAVGPSEAFMMAQLDDPTQLHALFAPLKLADRTLVLFPVSDHDEPEVVGGVHWSLLCFYRQQGADAFYHFDSLAGINKLPAERLAKRVAPLLATRVTSVVHAPTPQQQNGYDCGMYTIRIGEICGELCGEPVEAVSERIQATVTPDSIVLKRKEIIRMLQALMEEAQHPTSAAAAPAGMLAQAATGALAAAEGPGSVGMGAPATAPAAAGLASPPSGLAAVELAGYANWKADAAYDSSGEQTPDAASDTPEPP
jgi:sentrin-specific protease 8